MYDTFKIKYHLWPTYKVDGELHRTKSSPYLEKKLVGAHNDIGFGVP